MRAPAVLISTMGLMALAGCGSIGEPLYPALRIPSKVTDLAVIERGANLAISFTIPPVTTEGLAIKNDTDVDLRVGPSSPNGWNADEWAAGATSVPVPPRANPGPVDATLPAAKFIGREVVVAVRLRNPKGRDAGWSDFKTFNVQPPIADPTNFRVAADPKGVALSWNASGPSEFRIYRLAQDPAKPEPQARAVLLATATEPNYIDISAEYEKTYQYSIQAVRGMVESNLIGPETITPHDIFPPAVPSGLTALAGLGAVELAWTRNTESDFKEYRVLRSEEGAPFVQIAQGLDAPVYSDRAVMSGKHYRYEVVSVDQLGHVSAPSAPVEITAP